MAKTQTRAAYRKTHWTGGVAHSYREEEEQDLEFWLNASPSERIQGVTQLVEEMNSLIKGSDDSPPRLQRAIGGIRSRKS